MVSGASLHDLYRTVISLQSQRTYFFGIGSCEKCLHPLALPPAHKNRLRAAFPFAHSGRKGLNTILVKFVHARKNYPPSLLLAYHLLQDGEENRKVITMPLGRARAAQPVLKTHIKELYMRRGVVPPAVPTQPIANKTQARNATCV